MYKRSLRGAYMRKSRNGKWYYVKKEKVPDSVQTPGLHRIKAYKKTENGAYMRKAKTGNWYYVKKDKVPSHMISHTPQSKIDERIVNMINQTKKTRKQAGKEYHENRPGKTGNKFIDQYLKVERRKRKLRLAGKLNKNNTPHFVPHRQLDNIDINTAVIDTVIPKDFLLLNKAHGIEIPDKKGVFHDYHSSQGKEVIKRLTKEWKRSKYKSVRSLIKNINPLISSAGIQKEDGTEFIKNFLGIFRPGKTPCIFHKGTIIFNTEIEDGEVTKKNVYPYLGFSECKSKIVVRRLSVRERIMENGEQTSQWGHAVIIVFNREEETYWVMDPNGVTDKITQKYIDEGLKDMLKHYQDELEGFDIAYNVCPNIGPQDRQEDRGESGYCETWSQWFAIETILNPKYSSTEIFDHMIADRTPVELLNDIEKFNRLSHMMLSTNQTDKINVYRQTFRSPAGHKQMNGFHVTRFKTGTHMGWWKDGQLHGPGEYQDGYGNKMRGNWDNGIFTGNGAYEQPRGKLIYTFEGKWIDGEFEGQTYATI